MKEYAFRLAWVSYLAALLSVIVISPAGAYLDPGSGSLVFQVVVGALMAVSLAIRLFWRRIVSLFRRKESRDNG